MATGSKEMQNKVTNVTIGSDIEFFLENKDTKEIVSAEGLIMGSKYDPYKFDEDNDFFSTSLDNVLAEGNIPPVTNAVDFYKNIEKLRKFIDSTIPNELNTVCLPSARLDDKYLMTDNARIFGCDPSKNCWTSDQVHPQPKGDNMRSSGFHIHIGYDEPSYETNQQLAKAMDLFLGVPAVIHEPKNERKSVGYGQSGNYRDQRHGMEYRSLSGFFASDRNFIEWSFRNTMEAVQFVNDGRIEEIEGLSDVIQDCINNEDKETALNLIEKFKIKIV